MQTQEIDIKTQDGACDAFVARPDGNDAHPAVILYMDAFGVRPWLHEMAKTIAERGYYVLLPNLFYRIRRAPVIQGNFPAKPEDMPKLVEQIMPLFKTFTPELAMRDVAAQLDFLSKQKHVRGDKVGLTGYCMGGSLAIRAAAHFPKRIAAIGSFHAGNLATDAPESPHRVLGSIQGELYVAHADKDHSMPAEQVERFAAEIKSSGVRGKAELYEGAAHGYSMSDLPAYNERALKRHWDNLFPLLQRNL